ncbi:hypothetical protein OC25_16685 [Pedobacter kyungheensis]|uniref:YD repeat-containing protein n=1 Tax=Pedobacter kyungheensis TaxID=1069985 RepID=A0A0C1FKH6_9SPHI|nr:hypothetical protein [Pedobacter kyungheensis]KIA92323.1 hypothetical protein OC25_16685 [Pedobacter kyungheensis]
MSLNKINAKFRVAVLLTPVLIFLSIKTLKAQNLTDQIPPSPSSMQMQRYGDYPVSQYTGIPDIKIPIYTITEGDITVPIYLSFHASGLNLDECSVPLLIGPGWTLQAGGQMTRTVNGFPDEIFGVSTPDFSQNYQTSFQAMKDQVELYDSELDVYSYNALGLSGKFMPNANYLLDPYGPYKPFPLKENNYQLYPGAIIDDKGISYSFGGNNAEEWVQFQSRLLNTPYNAVTTWHLTTVSSAKFPGMGVGFYYQNGPQVGYQYSTAYMMDDAYYIAGQTSDPSADLGNNFPYSMPLDNNRVTNFSSRIYYPKFIEKIVFSTGFIKFILNTNKTLNRIEIYNKDQQLLRTVQLNIDKFGGASGSVNRLKSIVYNDALGNEQERYTFGYVGEFSPLGASSKDYWGFYNGQPYTGDYVPRFNVDISYAGGYYEDSRIGMFGGYANRDPDATFSVLYMLNQITYPTGGYTTFQYEGNTSNSGPVGGLRIKTISSYDRDGTLASKKDYNYWHGATEVYIEKDLFREEMGVISEGVRARRRSFLENAAIPLSPKGAPMGYQRVDETEGQRYTVYYFDDQPAYQYELLNSPLLYLNGRHEGHFRRFAHHYQPWNFGDLIIKAVSGPGFYKYEGYSYDSYINSTVTDLLIKRVVDFIPGSPGAPSESLAHETLGSLFNFAKQYHYSGVKRLSVKNTWDGDSVNGTGIGTTETYAYTDPLHPMNITSTSMVNSKEETIRTDLSYPYNFTGPVYDEMVSQNRIGEPIEQVQTNITKNKELSHMKMEYDFFNPTSSGPGRLHLKNIKKSVTGAPLEIEATAQRYDNRGHILQQVGKDGVIVSFIFGYNDNYPVAKIVGADYDTAIALVIPSYFNENYFSHNDTDMRNHLAAIRNGLPNAYVTTYTYKMGVGLTSETDPKGQTTFYEYDNIQRLKKIKDQNENIIKSFDYHFKH